jgi:4'-phosphopantetheinyl transferase
MILHGQQSNLNAERILSVAPKVERCGAFRLNMVREQRTINAALAFSFGRSALPTYEEAAEILQAGELEYFGRLTSNVRKKQFFLGRSVGKKAISLYLNETNLKGLEISSGVFLQPFVRYCSRDNPAVTLSHSADFAIAIAYEPGHIMGVDVEQIDSGRADIFRENLTEHEKNIARRTGCEQKLVSNVMWTIKEALSKAIKCGMTVPLDILAVEQLHVQSDGSFISNFKHFGQYKACSWLVRGFALSIALPKRTELQLDISTFGI